MEPPTYTMTNEDFRLCKIQNAHFKTQDVINYEQKFNKNLENILADPFSSRKNFRKRKYEDLDGAVSKNDGNDRIVGHQELDDDIQDEEACKIFSKNLSRFLVHQSKIRKLPSNYSYLLNSSKTDLIEPYKSILSNNYLFKDASPKSIIPPETKSDHIQKLNLKFENPELFSEKFQTSYKGNFRESFATSSHIIEKERINYRVFCDRILEKLVRKGFFVGCLKSFKSCIRIFC